MDITITLDETLGSLITEEAERRGTTVEAVGLGCVKHWQKPWQDQHDAIEKAAFDAAPDELRRAAIDAGEAALAAKTEPVVATVAPKN